MGSKWFPAGHGLGAAQRRSISDVTKAEGKKGQSPLFTITVTLSAAYDQAVTMSFRTVNGTAKTSDGDYVAKTGTPTYKVPPVQQFHAIDLWNNFTLLWLLCGLLGFDWFIRLFKGFA